MSEFFKIFVELLLCILIEAIINCVIPLIIRLLVRKPLNRKIAWAIAGVNYCLIFNIRKIIPIELLHVNSLTPDLFSALLAFANIYVLRFEKSKVDIKNLKKKLLIIISSVIVVTLIFAISLINDINNIENHDVKDDIKNYDKKDIIVNYDYSIKEVKSQKDFEKAISNKKYSIIYFGYEGCIFCDGAVIVLETLAKNYKLTNVYKVDIINNAINPGVDIYGYPALLIYRNNVLLDEKVGYADQTEMRELFYRMEIIGLLEKYNILGNDEL